MYDIRYLPLVKQDMVNIVSYISHELLNPQAANDLADAFIEGIDKLAEFPYIHPMYYPPKPLIYEYRKRVVKNYIVFYRVDEDKKEIVISRVIYQRRNYNGLLKYRRRSGRGICEKSVSWTRPCCHGERKRDPAGGDHKRRPQRKASCGGGKAWAFR